MGDVKLSCRETPAEEALDDVCRGAVQDPYPEIGDGWANSLFIFPIILCLTISAAAYSYCSHPIQEPKHTSQECIDRDYAARHTVDDDCSPGKVKYFLEK
jgi:hypothetical protein